MNHCNLSLNAPLVVTTLALPALAMGDELKQTRQCPNPGKMSSLCSQIGLAYLNPVTGINRMGKYKYQQTIYEAACVTPEEWEDGPEELVARKVQAAWEKYGKQVSCEDKGTRGGSNILKYGAANVLDSFMEDVVLSWHLDLNYYDEKDNGRTLLDFVDDQLAGPLGPETRKKFGDYRRLIIKGGGKKRAELDGHK